MRIGCAATMNGGFATVWVLSGRVSIDCSNTTRRRRRRRIVWVVLLSFFFLHSGRGRCDDLPIALTEEPGMWRGARKPMAFWLRAVKE